MASLAAFVINLARDQERRAHMQAQLEKIALPAEFIPAVDGGALSDADRALCDTPKTLRIYGTPMLDNEIGCYMSHYRLWQRIVREKIPVALIMEDDIAIAPALLRHIDALLNDARPEWLVVRLESLRPRVRDAKSAKFMGACVKQWPEGGLYKLKTHVLGFGAYLIRLEGAARMLAYGKRIFLPVDQTMDRFWENGVKPYIVRPIPVRQRQDFESSIGARPAGRHHALSLWQNAQRRAQRLADGVKKRLLTLFY